MLKAAGGPKGQTLADALASKAGQLRKASDANGVQRPANAPSAADNGGGSKTSTVSSTTSMGQPDFLSELTARFKNKKPATETAPETVNGASSGEAEKRTNGTCAIRSNHTELCDIGIKLPCVSKAGKDLRPKKQVITHHVPMCLLFVCFLKSDQVSRIEHSA